MPLTDKPQVLAFSNNSSMTIHVVGRKISDENKADYESACGGVFSDEAAETGYYMITCRRCWRSIEAGTYKRGIRRLDSDPVKIGEIDRVIASVGVDNMIEMKTVLDDMIEKLRDEIDLDETKMGFIPPGEMFNVGYLNALSRVVMMIEHGMEQLQEAE